MGSEDQRPQKTEAAQGWRGVHGSRSGPITALVVAAVLALAGCVESPPGDQVASTEPDATVEPGSVPQPSFDEAPQARVHGPVRAARESTMRVSIESCEQVLTGSGVAIGENLVLTNRHVVDRSQRVAFNLWGGQRVGDPTVRVSDEMDAALLQVDQGLEHHLELAEQDPEPGDRLTVVGHPGGGAQRTARGPAVDYQQPEDLPELDPPDEVLRIEALVQPGSSGGPVIDQDGRIAALVFAYQAGAGYALAIPASQLHDLVQEGPDALEEPTGCPS